MLGPVKKTTLYDIILSCSFQEHGAEVSRDPVGVSGALNADDQHRAMLGQTKKYLPDFKQHLRG